ncbi:subtilisin family serine protease [Thermocatellispora tengchongensis]|uniref:Subtilisin family serine protease n=1 Tax=Thermocatellispora tengchongensis TaxID=1073253 RepID=A0A840P899_9ACTN|nr:S8/S53 family peptidase [Thermocatellispora tengchongensis]MBB5135219.1 subtilisin family serine protease [Thermocatellispora tengchongensis]
MHAHVIAVSRTAGAPALIRPRQLLIDHTAVSAVERWSQGVSEHDGVCQVRLAPGVDPVALADDLRSQGLPASPNHVLVGQPLFFGGPATRPFPTGPVDPGPGGPPSLVSVAVLDTGIAPHPWWNDSPWYSERGAGSDELADSDGDLALDAQAGHGTFIAGLLLRRAPGVRLRIGRVLDGHGVGDEAGLLRALAGLRERPPQVLNLSLGAHTADDQPPPLLARALEQLPGTVVVACAGNTGSSRPFWPAALPGVVAVGALDAAGTGRAPFSAYGPWVNACAPGEWLASTFLSACGFSGYARWSGTSFAAALVSGAIADAARELPPADAAAYVLDPLRGGQIPDLGVLVPADR